MNIILPSHNLKDNHIRIKNGILYLRYGKSFQSIMYYLTYFMKGRNFCYYCKKRIPRNEITMDHMYPRSTGGPTIPQNLIPVCKECNSQKANMTVEQYMKFLSITSPSEQEKYLFKISKLKEGLKSIGMFEIPNEWILPVQTDHIHTNVDLANISETKLKKVESYYKTYNSFQRTIVLDRNLYSLDGFYMLLLAKTCGISYLPATILENVEIQLKSN